MELVREDQKTEVRVNKFVFDLKVAEVDKARIKDGPGVTA